MRQANIIFPDWLRFDFRFRRFVSDEFDLQYLRMYTKLFPAADMIDR